MVVVLWLVLVSVRGIAVGAGVVKGISLVQVLVSRTGVGVVDANWYWCW